MKRSAALLCFLLMMHSVGAQEKLISMLSSLRSRYEQVLQILNTAEAAWMSVNEELQKVRKLSDERERYYEQRESYFTEREKILEKRMERLEAQIKQLKQDKERLEQQLKEYGISEELLKKWRSSFERALQEAETQIRIWRGVAIGSGILALVMTGIAIAGAVSR